MNPATATEAQVAAAMGLDLETFHAARRLNAALEIVEAIIADAEPKAEAIPADQRPKKTEGLAAVAEFMDCAACKLELMLQRVVMARTGDGAPLTH